MRTKKIWAEISYKVPRNDANALQIMSRAQRLMKGRISTSQSVFAKWSSCSTRICNDNSSFTNIKETTCVFLMHPQIALIMQKHGGADEIYMHSELRVFVAKLALHQNILYFLHRPHEKFWWWLRNQQSEYFLENSLTKNVRRTFDSVSKTETNSCSILKWNAGVNILRRDFHLLPLL